MTLRTDTELDRALTELAAAAGISKQDVIRRAVLKQHAEMDHESRVADASARMREKWGTVLDRLGSV